MKGTLILRSAEGASRRMSVETARSHAGNTTYFLSLVQVTSLRNSGTVEIAILALASFTWRL